DPATTPMYAYKWTIRRNNAVVLKEAKLDLSTGKDRIEIEGDQPEMIYVGVAASGFWIRRGRRQGGLLWSKYRPQHRTLRRRWGGSVVDGTLDAGSGRHRRILGCQTRGEILDVLVKGGDYKPREQVEGVK